jgi:putative spermidine/putrescine transport system substrate-binding protein
MTFARLSTLAVLLVAGVLGAGCGSSDSKASTPSAGRGSSTTTSAVHLSGKKLVFVDYGGETLTAAKKAWLEPFEAKTGAQVATDSPSDPAKVKAMVQAGNPTWDVIDLDPASGASQCGKLYVTRKSLGVNITAVDPKYVTDACGVPVLLQVIALVYNKKLYGAHPPTRITDFLRVKQFPGTRMIFNYPVGGLEPLLLATGIAPGKLYPLDFARAASTIKQLGSNLELPSDLAQMTQSQESGTFGMCLCYLGRSAIAKLHGADIGVVWDHAYVGWDELYAIKGSKNTAAQAALMNYIATPGPQAKFTENEPYAPTTPASRPHVSATFKEFLPAGHDSQIGTPAVYDAAWWLKNTDVAFAKWTAMTAG